MANAVVRVEGRRLYPDVLMQDQPLVIEVDGYAVHGGRVAFQKDRERLNLFAQAGFTVLRFTWEDLTQNPATVVTRIRRTLRGKDLLLDGTAGA